MAERWMMHFALSVIIVCLLTGEHTTNGERCKRKHYLQSNGACVPCSKCPADERAVIPCTRTKDVVCAARQNRRLVTRFKCSEDHGVYMEYSDSIVGELQVDLFKKLEKTACHQSERYMKRLNQSVGKVLQHKCQQPNEFVWARLSRGRVICRKCSDCEGGHIVKPCQGAQDTLCSFDRMPGTTELFNFACRRQKTYMQVYTAKQHVFSEMRYEKVVRKFRRSFCKALRHIIRASFTSSEHGSTPTLNALISKIQRMNETASSVRTTMSPGQTMAAAAAAATVTHTSPKLSTAFAVAGGAVDPSSRETKKLKGTVGSSAAPTESEAVITDSFSDSHHHPYALASGVASSTLILTAVALSVAAACFFCKKRRSSQAVETSEPLLKTDIVPEDTRALSAAYFHDPDQMCGASRLGNRQAVSMNHVNYKVTGEFNQQMQKRRTWHPEIPHSTKDTPAGTFPPLSLADQGPRHDEQVLPRMAQLPSVLGEQPTQYLCSSNLQMFYPSGKFGETVGRSGSNTELKNPVSRTEREDATVRKSLHVAPHSTGSVKTTAADVDVHATTPPAGPATGTGSAQTLRGGSLPYNILLRDSSPKSGEVQFCPGPSAEGTRRYSDGSSVCVPSFPNGASMELFWSRHFGLDGVGFDSGTGSVHPAALMSLLKEDCVSDHQLQTERQELMTVEQFSMLDENGDDEGNCYHADSDENPCSVESGCYSQ